MKFNFKKISAVLASGIMVASGIGFAAAASFPAPFSDGTAAGTAIVYSSNAAMNDMDAVTSINNYLKTKVKSDGSAPEGESYLFEKTSTKFQVGYGILDVTSVDLNDDHLPTLLADGEYVDDDNDQFSYTQSIDLPNLTLSMFDNDQYKDNTPTLGFQILNNARVLNYTLDFVDEPLWADLPTSTMKFMGKDYYVSSVTANTTINLLDAANTVLLKEDETKSLTVDDKTYEIAVVYLSTTEVKLSVDGVVTNSLQEGQTQRISDDVYVGVKDILQRDVSGTIGSVEVSIGSGKLELKNGNNLKMNDESISGLVAYITASSSTSGDKLNKLVVDWTVSSDSFVTDDKELVMPGFESLKFTFGGVTFPAEEKIKLEAGGNDFVELSQFPLKDATVTIPLAYYNGSNYNLVGKDNDERLRTSTGTSITFNDTSDTQFVLSWSDGNSGESYLVRATDIREDTDVNENYTDLEYYKDGAWIKAKEDRKNGDIVSVGQAEVTVGVINDDDNTVAFSVSGNNNFNTLYSKEGMKVWLPKISTNASNFSVANLSGAGTSVATVARACGNASAIMRALDARVLSYEGIVQWNNSGTQTFTECRAGFGPTTFVLNFSEEDKNEDVDLGNNILATFSADSQSEASIETVAHEGRAATRAEIGDTDVFKSFAYSALATEVLEDESNDREAVTLVYHGRESFGKLYLASSSAMVSTVGNMLFKDNEKSSWQDRNVVLIGGSCINAATAEKLGGTKCSEEFTSTTNVGAGQFLIETFDGFSTGKVAVVAAGYEAADTLAAVNYLKSASDLDTTVGKKYVGTVAQGGSVSVAAA